MKIKCGLYKHTRTNEVYNVIYSGGYMVTYTRPNESQEIYTTKEDFMNKFTPYEPETVLETAPTSPEPPTESTAESTAEPSHYPEGRKFDQGKPRYGLLPPEALADVVAVLTYGANKYAPDNWRKVDNAIFRYFDAAQRHIWAYARGEITDPESGYPHLAHAACCLLFMLELDK